MMLHEASFYIRDGEEVKCTLCAQQCDIQPDRLGKCGVRQNKGGKLYSLVYGQLVAENIDPIEKKPLFHILPGTKSLSISTMGCNFRCHHCQNSSISQVAGLSQGELQGRYVSPEQIAENARKNGCASISYTYVEPTIFYEYAFDCAVAANDLGVKNVFVSNGYLSAEATKEISPYLDGINIDLKSYSDDFYHKVCGARLAPVLDCIRLMRELGVWVEVTTLLISGLNDDDNSLKQIASFIHSVDPAIPWHVTAFHPMYRMTDRPPTSPSSLSRARKIGVEYGLPFVYEGNMPGRGSENTHCHHCGELVIERFGFSIRSNKMLGESCPACSKVIPGVWQ